MGDNPIKNLGNKASKGFAPGTSGNPGGRPSLTKTHEYACAHDPDLAEAAGMTLEEARAKLYAVEMKVALAGPKGPKDSNWTFAMGDMMNRHFGKPKETVEIAPAPQAVEFDEEGMTNEEIDQALDAIGTLRKLALVPVSEPIDDDAPTEH